MHGTFYVALKWLRNMRGKTLATLIKINFLKASKKETVYSNPVYCKRRRIFFGLEIKNDSLN